MPRSAHTPSSAQPTPVPQQAAPTYDAGNCNIGNGTDGNVPTHVLVVTHTAQGEILSLHWPQSNDCRDCENLVGQSVASLFGPVAVEPYLERVQKVLATQKPEEFKCVVRCGHHPVSFEFLLSPLPPSTVSHEARANEAVSESARVVGVGRRILPEVAQLKEIKLADSNGTLGNNNYYALLSSVASNIRRTLDLNTIWQQTVSGLGNMLGLDRCLVCDYSKAMQTLTVVAEYYQPGLHPCLGKTFDLALKSDFLNTLKSLEPVISDFERGHQSGHQNGESEQPYTVLTVATCYRIKSGRRSPTPSYLTKAATSPESCEKSLTRCAKPTTNSCASMTN
jgi:hypothetical protein